MWKSIRLSLSAPVHGPPYTTSDHRQRAAAAPRPDSLKHKFRTLISSLKFDHDQLERRQVLRFAEEELDPIDGPVADDQARVLA